MAEDSASAESIGPAKSPTVTSASSSMGKVNGVPSSATPGSVVW
jgi:hypothetical protein